MPTGAGKTTPDVRDRSHGPGLRPLNMSRVPDFTTIGFEATPAGRDAPAGEPWLTEGQTYTLILPIPEGDSDVGGFRAIDRATLFRDQKREFAFQVGPKANVPPEPSVTFCRDVLPIFAAKCSLPTCHGSGDRAAAGLVLDTSAGVSATAIRRLAQGSNTGSRSAQAASGNRFFGVDMPIIDPGSPGNSWLLYKVELARQPAPRQDPPSYACTVGLNEPSAKFVFAPLVPQAQRAADDIERSILDDFILGREMPFPPSRAGAYEDEPLTFDEREKLRLWIQSLPADGVSVPDCGGCGVLPDADAGVSDSGTDASAAGDAGDGGPGDAADQ